LLPEERRNFGRIVPDFKPKPFESDQAEALKLLIKREQIAQGCQVIAITSGKGGVGKTNLAVNLSLALADVRKKVLLVDLDLGLANADILFNLNPIGNLASVVEGKKRLTQVMVQVHPGIHFIPGATGVDRLANLDERGRGFLLDQLEEITCAFDYMIFDTGPGISRNTIAFAARADKVIVLTVPEPTAIIDAYTVIKMLTQEEDFGEISVLINMANGSEAERCAQGMVTTANRHLHCYIQRLGHIPHDPRISLAVRQRKPFYLAYPHTEASKALRKVVQKICQWSERSTSELLPLRPGFVKRLWALFSRNRYL
jgi:flagellar biosynthesis protein FlhG